MPARHFILVHGAWHTHRCWASVSALLHTETSTVQTPDLPGHGSDQTPFTQIHLQTYVNYIANLIAQSPKPVTLVGHSMAGMIISQVANQIPNHLAELIYVAAFVPRHRESLSLIARRSPTPGLSTEIETDLEAASLTLRKTSYLQSLLFNRCTEKKAQEALLNLQPEPYYPFVEAVSLSQEGSRVLPKRYILCAYDRVLPPSHQKIMAEQAQCRTLILKKADHAPFYSCPAELAQALLVS